MKNLQTAWAFLLLAGLWLIYVDAIYRTLLDIKGVPVLTTLGAALILLALTSILNWLFKEAWEEHSRANPHHHEDGPAG